jgi:photosystem II stability/assembly factor-like uncharacterized protein
MKTFKVSVVWLVLLVAVIAGQTSVRPDATLLSGLKFRSIGPVNTSGRIDDIAVAQVPGQPDAIYVGTASGGVFKSVNGGVSWTPIFDNVDAMMSIGALAVSASDANVVWVGTGEANNRQSSSWGDGVYKSTNAGRTWKFVGLKDTRHIGRIVLHPTNSQIAYVAAVGHLWGPNAERGVFKTIDGGATWKKTLYVDENTGATDLAIDSKNPQTLYAATYQRQRKSWGFNGGGPGSGVYKSTDGGERWTRLTSGLPAGDKGRIALALRCDADKTRGSGITSVYALIEASTGNAGGRGAAAAAPGAPAQGNDAGLYRSNDDGATWEHLSTLNTRPSYFSQIRVDPNDRSRLYELGSNRGFYVSDDAGKTFADTGVNGIHGEDHALWIDPADTNHLIIGGDGGVSISHDRGRTWDFRMNMPIGQFYEIDADMKVPYTVCGGLQDNGEWCVPSAVRDRNGISMADGWNVGGGDGFHVKFDPTDWNQVYAESQDGNMGRVDLTTLQRQSIKPLGPYRWNWDTPILVSSIDPRVIYSGANVLFRSTDRGTTWTTISPDLTAQADPAAMKIMGAVTPATALSKDDGTSLFGSLTTISESPLDAQVIYTGAQDGTVEVTRDGGKKWTNLTAKFPGLPQSTYVSTVLASRYAAGRVYATFDGHYGDDYKPYIYVSEDFGEHWRPLTAGLPETSINRLREHPRNPHVLVLAHERGVHVSADDGQTWLALSLVTNLPTVPVDDIVIHARDNALILGTHGRSLWILDDVGPLELLAQDTLKLDAALAPIAPAREMVLHASQAWFGQGIFFAPNPDFGAGLNYYLRSQAPGMAAIEISDGAGNVIRHLPGTAAKGLNRVLWDLRADLPPPAADVAVAGRGGRGGGPPQGPLVTPGKFQVSIKIPGIDRELKGDLVVERDPITGTRR